MQSGGDRPFWATTTTGFEAPTVTSTSLFGTCGGSTQYSTGFGAPAITSTSLFGAGGGSTQYSTGFGATADNSNSLLGGVGRSAGSFTGFGAPVATSTSTFGDLGASAQYLSGFGATAVTSTSCAFRDIEASTSYYTGVGGTAVTSTFSGLGAPISYSTVFGATTVNNASSTFGGLGASAQYSSGIFGSPAVSRNSTSRVFVDYAPYDTGFGASSATSTSTFGSLGSSAQYSTGFGATTVNNASSRFGGNEASAPYSTSFGATAVTNTSTFRGFGASTSYSTDCGVPAVTSTSTLGFLRDFNPYFTCFEASSVTSKSTFGGLGSSSAQYSTGFGATTVTNSSSTFRGIDASASHSTSFGATSVTNTSTIGYLGASTTTSTSTFGGLGSSAQYSTGFGANGGTSTSAFGLPKHAVPSAGVGYNRALSQAQFGTPTLASTASAATGKEITQPGEIRFGDVPATSAAVASSFGSGGRPLGRLPSINTSAESSLKLNSTAAATAGIELGAQSSASTINTNEKRHGSYRDQNAQPQLCMQQESNSRYSNRKNSSQTSTHHSHGQNVNSFKQNVNYQQKPNSQVRSFSSGREIDSQQYHSLNQKRMQENQFPRQINCGLHRNDSNPRGNGRGSKRNYNPNLRSHSQGNGSDNESVSSNNSQSNSQVSKDHEELVNHLPNRSSGNSQAASNYFFSQSTSSNNSAVNRTPNHDNISRYESSLSSADLAELGKNIVEPSFPAKYSKLILSGIQFGLGFEAVVLTAFLSVKGRVFKYFADPKSQRLIDAVKLQLIQRDSDTLSYLSIYKTWLENNRSDEWCSEHYINCKTLHIVYSKVNEICQTVSESWKENISQEFSSAKDYATSLLELLFECFKENLCVFTGHYRSGYRILSSQSIAFLHPSSIICQRENLPPFIIFDHMIQTSRDFLVDITAIPTDFVMQGLEDLSDDFDSKFANMFENYLVERVIEPVGERMINQVLLGHKGNKLKLIEDQIKNELKIKSLVISPIAEKGQVCVYALTEHVNQAVELVNEKFRGKFEEIINSEQTNALELKRGQIKVHVEVKWIKGASVISIKTGTYDKTLVPIQNNRDGEGNPSDQPPTLISQSINLTWTRRPCNGKGFITLKREDFMPASKLAMQCFKLLGSEVFVQLSKFAPNQLYVIRIPPETKICEFEAAFSVLLPGIAFEKVELMYAKPFKTSQNEIQEMKNTIEEICRKNTELVNFSIVIPVPKDSATVMKAYINVSHHEDIASAANRLSECTMGDFKLESKAVYSSVIKCRVEIYKALKDRIEKRERELQDELGTDFKFIYKVSDDMAAIKMLYNSREILLKLQRAVNELLEGEVLNKMFNKDLGKVFCHGGHMWLQTLEESCKVHINKNHATKTLRLYGSEDGCYSAKERIRQFLEDTENEVVKRFSLPNRKLLKVAIIEYGANLEKFIESCELRSASLDIKSCSLTVHGNRESIEKADEILKGLSECLGSTDVSKVLSNEEMCPVCECSALNLTFRLELCGHLYCSECIQGLVDQAEFPLKCCADKCQKDICLDDIFKILEDDDEKITALLHKAVKFYIEVHQAEIFNCPAPDCSMFFYKRDLSVNKINCPLCQNDICRECNAIFHQGLSCDMYQGSKNDADYSLKVYQKSRAEVKNCPQCKITIEKNGGCNHMTCPFCNSHICWQCMQLFPDARSVYDHMPYCHMYGKGF